VFRHPRLNTVDSGRPPPPTPKKSRAQMYDGSYSSTGIFFQEGGRFNGILIM
jgi:hypothetical protein